MMNKNQDKRNENWAIDTHGHLGQLGGLPQKHLEQELCTLSMEQLKRQYQQAEVKIAMVSSMEGLFYVDGLGVKEGNQRLEELVSKTDWLYQWVIVNPLEPKTYYQAETILKNPKCVGVKVHPEAHHFPIKEYGEELFSFCSQQKAIMQIHSGEANSMPEDMVAFADNYPEVTVIAAHLGCGSDGDPSHQVRAIKRCKNGNIYTDISSVRSILPGILEWAVEQIGAEKLLFGTDTPLHHIGMMKARVIYSELSYEQKQRILHKNAEKLFHLKIV